MNLSQFAQYDVSAWLFEDGVTSRHVEVAAATAARPKLHGKLRKAVFTVGAMLLVSTTLTIASGTDAATRPEIKRLIEAAVPAEEGSFAQRTGNLIARFNAGIPLGFSAETMALARRAVDHKIDFSTQPIDAWARGLGAKRPA